ncbi:MAG: reverse transcriptase-like protein [Candidatus Gracilibacteria bacterium]|nr:reverse transcriptase-like protein [bacterium]MDZ4217116.1 reverse transcriptase-like protein [Candidatus Gracilibacteria bacterium]
MAIKKKPAEKLKLVVLIDGNNLRHAIRSLIHSEDIHWKTFFDLIRKDYTVVGAKYYIGKVTYPLFEEEKVENQTKLINNLKKAGIETYLGHFNEQKQEKGVDIQMALDLVVGAVQKSFDAALLISGDGDLADSVKIAQDFGVRVILGYVAGTKSDRYRVSYRLKSVAQSQAALNKQITEAHQKLTDREEKNLQEKTKAETKNKKKATEKKTTPKVEKLKEFLVFSDGGARGNPGPSGCGAVISDPKGQVLEKISTYIGEGTNNQAEYHALLLGLDAVSKKNPEKITCYLDSELIVKQVNGQYKVRNIALKEYYDQVKLFQKKFPNTSFHHIPRSKNKLADKLANDAMDRKK